MHRWEDFRTKTEIHFIFRFHRRPIQLVMFVLLSLLSFSRKKSASYVSVEVSLVAWLELKDYRNKITRDGENGKQNLNMVPEGKVTAQTGRPKKLLYPKRPA